MRVRNQLLKFSFLLCLIACNNCNNNETAISYKVDNTSLFSEYLQKTFNLSIDNKKRCYFIISSQGCGDCIKKLVLFTQENLMMLDTSQVMFINANPTIEPILKYEFKSLCKVDSFSEISDYALGITNVTMIFTQQSKVDSIVPLKWGDEVKIMNFIGKK